MYTGAWGDWDTANEGNYKDTIKYLNKPTGKETVELEFVGTGIEVITCTNTDLENTKYLLTESLAER